MTKRGRRECSSRRFTTVFVGRPFQGRHHRRLRDPKRVALQERMRSIFFFLAALAAQAPPPPVPQAPKAAAPIDLTGYWVSIVSEDWRYRMVTPAKGDYQAVPMTPEAVKIADAWNPDADTAAGNQCKSYGAPAIMRVPGRIHVTWDDDKTLKVEADAGTQTRLLGFDAATASKGEASWQGHSIAQWEMQ